MKITIVFVIRMVDLVEIDLDGDNISGGMIFGEMIGNRV